MATEDEYEVLAASMPAGMAVIDTGCTTSVCGTETASRYVQLLADRGLPAPREVELPPVQPKGFNGVKSTSLPCSSKRPGLTPVDLNRHFQTVVKHTCYSAVDVGTHRYSLRMLFGMDVDFGLCAYRPCFERIPKQASSQTLVQSVACLERNGSVTRSPWRERMPSARRGPSSGTCICKLPTR